MPRRPGAKHTQPTRVSIRAFAKSVGVSHPAIRKAIAAGRLRFGVGRDARGPYISDEFVARKEWDAAHAKPGNGAAPVAGAKGARVRRAATSLVEAKLRVDNARATGLELANRRRRGELLEAAVVEREQFEIARVVRDGVLNVADRVSAELAAEKDPKRVHAMLVAELRQALGAIAEVLERE